MTTQNYRVDGMTCAHCASSVQQEVEAVPGVNRAEVDLPTGGLAVTVDAPVADERIGRAVGEAGYALAGRS